MAPAPTMHTRTEPRYVGPRWSRHPAARDHAFVPPDTVRALLDPSRSGAALLDVEGGSIDHATLWEHVDRLAIEHPPIDLDSVDYSVRNPVEFEALSLHAELNLRPVPNEVRYIVREALQRAGLLKQQSDRQPVEAGR